MLSTVTLAATLVTATVAHAQPGLTPLASPSAPVSEPAELKSPTTATLLALGGAVAPVVMIAVGGETGNDGLISGGFLASTLTPSLGHWYAGEFLTTGMALRGVGGLLFITGVAQALSGACWGGGDCGGSGGGGENDGAALILLGAGSYVGGTVYDVATAGAAARRYNRTHGAQMAVAPTMIPSAGGAMAMGMGVRGSF